MNRARILTNSQVFERYLDDDTKEAMLAREAISQGCRIALIECNFFSRLRNTPFLTDVSIEAIKKELPDNAEVILCFFIDTSLLDSNQLVVAFRNNS